MNDVWWPVALSDALDPGQVLAVPLHGREHVLWRDATGALHAHDDRCPHRGMRLSYGFVREARLTCPYHGWQFDGSGQCRALPALPAVTPATTMAVRAHPVATGDELIWLRAPAGADTVPTDAAAAAAASPPHLSPTAVSPSADTPPQAGWPAGLSAAPVRSRYLRADAAAVHAAMHALDLGAPRIPPAATPGTARTGSALLADGDRGLGWGLQPTGDGRTGLHVVALARGGVDAAWRLAVSRALRTLPLPV